LARSPKGCRQEGCILQVSINQPFQGLKKKADVTDGPKILGEDMAFRPGFGMKTLVPVQIFGTCLSAMLALKVLLVDLTTHSVPAEVVPDKYRPDPIPCRV